MGWTAPASDRAAATVKESKLDSAFDGNGMQRTVGLVNFPGAAKHSAIFVGVGITQHYLLLPVP